MLTTVDQNRAYRAFATTASVACTKSAGTTEFCNLPFDPACLEFHETARTVPSLPSAALARQPCTATPRAARFFGDKLDRLRHPLREAGVAVRGRA